MSDSGEHSGPRPTKARQSPPVEQGLTRRGFLATTITALGTLILVGPSPSSEIYETKRDTSPVTEPVPEALKQNFADAVKFDVCKTPVTEAALARNFTLMTGTHELPNLSLREIRERAEIYIKDLTDAHAILAPKQPRLPTNFNDLSKDALGANKFSIATYKAAARKFFSDTANFGMDVLTDWTIGSTKNMSKVLRNDILPLVEPVGANDPNARKRIVAIMQAFARHDKSLAKGNDATKGKVTALFGMLNEGLDEPGRTAAASTQIEYSKTPADVFMIFDIARPFGPDTDGAASDALALHELFHAQLPRMGMSMLKPSGEYHDPALAQLIPKDVVYGLKSLDSVKYTGLTEDDHYTALSSLTSKGIVVGVEPESFQNVWDHAATTFAAVVSGSFGEMLYAQSKSVDTKPVVAVAALTLARLEITSPETANLAKSFIAADRLSALIKARLKSRESEPANPRSDREIASLNTILTKIHAAKYPI